jgi:hypothetical protein
MALNKENSVLEQNSTNRNFCVKITYDKNCADNNALTKKGSDLPKNGYIKNAHIKNAHIKNAHIKNAPIDAGIGRPITKKMKKSIEDHIISPTSSLQIHKQQIQNKVCFSIN